MNNIALPEGFTLVRGWAWSTRLDGVIHEIPWSQSTIRIYGRDILQPRMTAWMGDAAYTYSGRTHEPAPLSPALAALRMRVSAAAGVHFTSVLANLYRTGSDSVAWHADDEPELGTEPVIASLSLGDARTFKIRRNADGVVWSVQLGHGDLLIMRGRSQADYQHCVPKTKTDVGARINLTFRVL